jgi:hypothetical protein
MELTTLPNPRGEALAMCDAVDQHIKQQHGSFWEPSIQRLAKIAKVPSRTARPAPACLRTRAPS